ncbi:hypothetical protein N7494_009675 [Penicillium frequentans]|uniref:Uncharacterized protein n=1 Tax=Penicillium frequentans TaxID=3151616 RepID=A0AAD6CQF1_9EURO|nr:hypothetical protein N7494_009675 [Penicillium glabrum]
MDAELHGPPSPVSLLDGYITEQETVLWVRTFDRHLQNTTIATDDGERLFYVEGPGAYQSMSLRRHLKDASGNHVFDLRRYPSDPRMRWFVQEPNGNKLAELGHKKFFTSKHTAIDAKVLSTGTEVEMRPRDATGSTNYVNIGNVTIAEITLHTNNTTKRFVQDRDLSVFRVRVAKGADMSLVS